MSISESKICLLNGIELCVTLFRGPDSPAWAKIAESGVPDLLDRVQRYSAFAPGPIRDLHASLNACSQEDQGFDLLEPEFVRLFIASPGGIPAPLYESCHLGDTPRTMGQSALTMRDRLAEAGLTVDLDSNEPPDHLTIELEYLFHLLITGWSGDDPATANHGVAFARNVMLPWVRSFRGRVAGCDPHPVFLASADLVLTVLEAVAEA